MRMVVMYKRTFSVDISLDDNADASYAIKRNLDVLVIAPVAHACHVYTFCLVFLVS